jgi:hypothetical protein
VKKIWKTYNKGAVNRKVNSIGSVVPANKEAKVAEIMALPAIFRFVLGIIKYIAKAAPVKLNILVGKVPLTIQVSLA